MNKRLVYFAISVNGYTARQIVCSMFSAAGAQVRVYQDETAIIQSTEPVQAVVLDLGAAPDRTLDAIVLLRARLGTTPIYVIADPEDQPHAERAVGVGATRTIQRQALRESVGAVVQQVAQANGIPSWGIRTPPAVLVPTTMHTGYEVETIALDDWLLIPGNRRLLGMEESDAADPGPAAAHDAHAADEHLAPPVNRQPDPDPSPAPGEEATGQSAGPAAPNDEAAGRPCKEAGCPSLNVMKEEQEARIAAARYLGKEQFTRLEGLIQALRQDLQGHFGTVMRPPIDQPLVGSEASPQVNTKLLVDRAVTEVRQESAAALRRLYAIIGGLVLTLLLGALGLVSLVGLP